MNQFTKLAHNLKQRDRDRQLLLLQCWKINNHKGYSREKTNIDTAILEENSQLDGAPKTYFYLGVSMIFRPTIIIDR